MELTSHRAFIFSFVLFRSTKLMPSGLASKSNALAAHARFPQGEISSLSLEPWPQSQQPASSNSGEASPQTAAGAAAAASPGSAPQRPAGVVVSLFEVPYTPANVAAFIAREHEFRFVAVQPTDLSGVSVGRTAVSGAGGCCGPLGFRTVGLSGFKVL